MRNYRGYKVWPKAYKLALDLYRATRNFPSEERFGLTAQIRRAAVSIPSNFAEGMGRAGDREKGRFVSIAIGSANELEVQLELSADLEYLERDLFYQLRKQLLEVRRMLIGFNRSLCRATHSA